MPLQFQRLLHAAVPSTLDAFRPPSREREPETIVFGARAGAHPSQRPPVEIFVGSERGQFRAEHNLLWSIEKHRDPTRIYRVHLLRDLQGFRRRFWLTGFTNYRFAIPALAEGEGRAIYNDADQIYLADPGELFDTPMNGRGYLSINERDSSVMLLDCRRMQAVWTLRDAQSSSRRNLERQALAQGLWGPLDETWNARDSEHESMRSRLVHFTTLHTQPWCPFPHQYVYFDNPTDPLWADLEQESIDAGFMPIHACRPSRRWHHTWARLSRRHDADRLLAVLATPAPSSSREQHFVADFLQEVPDLDVPWVLERLFQVFGEVILHVDEPALARPDLPRRSRWFWLQHLQLAARRHPETRWRLRYRQQPWRCQWLHGGPISEGSIIVLTHRKPGHNQQAKAIARRLSERSGLRLEHIEVGLSEPEFALRLLLRRPLAVAVPDDAQVIVASAWVCGGVARQLARKLPRLRLVLSGRKAGPVPEHGAVVIQCAHFNLPPHPNRLITTLPLNAGEAVPTRMTDPWQGWLQAERRFALLVGGSSRFHTLDPQRAQAMLRHVCRWAERYRAQLLVVTSRRSADLIPVIDQELPKHHYLYRWSTDDPANPYALVLRHADQLVVTGESESMLADAVSRGRQFLIWPVPARSGLLWQRFAEKVAVRAVQPRINRRGTIRPQQGLTYLCARAVERCWVLPPRDIGTLHGRLYAQRLAAPFGQGANAAYDASLEFEQTIAATMELLALRDAGQSSGCQPVENSRAISP
ncbi:MAG: ELM1/GtrOC1 family putative glycosyltransferase [Gammaproteobacteria bacterium]